ncbi:MAG: SpoIIIAC/SpoIIIAD family protein [Eubacterium sp.]
MIKITAIALISLVLIIFLRNTNREFAFILTVASSLILFSIVINDFFQVIERVNEISSQIENLNSYVSLMVKILGITLITQFVIDLCRDSGENALASQTEITSKIIILIMIMPLFEAVMNVVTGLLK